MKTINYLSALTFILLSFSTFGQDEKPVKRISISDLQIYTGILVEHDIIGTFEDFSPLAPQSEILKSDMSDFSNPPKYAVAGNPSVSVLMGVQFRDKDKKAYKANPLLRLGFNYFTGTTLTSGLGKSYGIPYDTLMSSQTGKPIYIDSGFLESYGLSYSSKQLRFDGSLIFRTNPAARLSVYSGIGITAGISIASWTNIHYMKKSYRYSSAFEYRDVFGMSKYDRTESRNEDYKNKMNYSASAYIPIGIDFRLGRDNKFLKHIHLFYELKLAMGFTSIPELYTVTNTNYQHGLGLRISFNEN